MMNILLPLLLLLAGAAHPAGDGPVRYGDYFLDKALRIDLFHMGTWNSERVAIDKLKEDKIYAGPRVALAAPPDLGAYRLELRDAASGRLIFARGYCGLFQEWRTTAEARSGAWRAIEHSLVAPYPKAPVTLDVLARDGSKGWKKLLKQTLSMKKRFIDAGDHFPGALCKPIQVEGEPASKVDLLIMGDGYTAKEMPAFEKDAREAADSIFAVEPFKTRRSDFNVWVVETPSAESGVDEPRHALKGEGKKNEQAFKATPFQVTFNFFDLPRYALTDRIHTLYDAASCAPHDVILLLFNSSRMGGGGIYNLYAVSSAKSAVSARVLVHELGHAFAGLADEYYSGKVSYIEYYPDGVEPWEPNITALADPRRIKWKALLTPGVPIPTPALRKYRNAVGAFEGAGYRAKGLYRPCFDCLMNTLRGSRYCPVCRKAVEKAIDYDTQGADEGTTTTEDR